MDSIISTVNEVSTSVKEVVPALAGLIIVIIGIMYMLSKDSQTKQQYTGWITNVAIGFVLVYAGASLVTWFSGKVDGF